VLRAWFLVLAFLRSCAFLCVLARACACVCFGVLQASFRDGNDACCPVTRPYSRLVVKNGGRKLPKHFRPLVRQRLASWPAAIANATAARRSRGPWLVCRAAGPWALRVHVVQHNVAIGAEGHGRMTPCLGSRLRGRLRERVLLLACAVPAGQHEDSYEAHKQHPNNHVDDYLVRAAHVVLRCIN